MLAYLILTQSYGAPIDEAQIRRFETNELRELPFVPAERMVWRSFNGSCVFIGWQAFTDLAGIGSHWVNDKRGLTAFGGHCWPRATGWDHASGRTWAEQLRTFLDTHALPDAREELFGQFTLVELDANGNGMVTPDFASFDPVFLASGGGLTAISNRSGLCARAISSSDDPERSLTGAGWMICHAEMFFDGETGYWDVERIPLGAHIAIDRSRGASIVEAERCPLGPMGVSAEYDELLPLVERDLRQTIRAIAALPIEQRKLGLSGGIDSRLLTAAIIHEGLQDHFEFVTFGPPARADPMVAQAVAQRFGLKWSTIDRSEKPANTEEREIRTHTAFTEGLMNGWNSVGSTSYSSTAFVSGSAGEYLRWGPSSRAGMSVASKEELHALLRRNVKFDPMRIMRPELLDYYHQTVTLWANDLLEQGESLHQAATYFNRAATVRHRFAVLHAWGAHITLTPYLTPTIVRANQMLAVDKRPDHRFHVDLMRRFEPALSKMPFAEKGWSEEHVAHLSDASDYRAITPVFSSSPEGRTWRVLRYQDYRPFLETYLLDRSNPIHELIDSDRLEKIIPTGDAHPGRTRRIWALLTAAIWMGRHELTTRIAH